MEALFTFNPNQFQHFQNSSNLTDLEDMEKKKRINSHSYKFQGSSKTAQQAKGQIEKLSFIWNRQKNNKYDLQNEKEMSRKKLTGDDLEIGKCLVQKSRKNQRIYTLLSENERRNQQQKIKQITTFIKRAVCVDQKKPTNKQLLCAKLCRKSKISASAKLTPKIYLPPSDSKLPPVFKSRVRSKHLKTVMPDQNIQNSIKFPPSFLNQPFLEEDQQALHKQLNQCKMRLIKEMILKS